MGKNSHFSKQLCVIREEIWWLQPTADVQNSEKTFWLWRDVAETRKQNTPPSYILLAWLTLWLRKCSTFLRNVGKLISAYAPSHHRWKTSQIDSFPACDAFRVTRYGTHTVTLPTWVTEIKAACLLKQNTSTVKRSTNMARDGSGYVDERTRLSESWRYSTIFNDNSRIQMTRLRNIITRDYWVCNVFGRAPKAAASSAIHTASNLTQYHTTEYQEVLKQAWIVSSHILTDSASYPSWYVTSDISASVDDVQYQK
jgi:hypothetical protein